MNGHEARRMTKLIRREVIPLAERQDVNSICPFLGNPARGRSSGPDRPPSVSVRPIFRAAPHADHPVQPGETRVRLDRRGFGCDRRTAFKWMLVRVLSSENDSIRVITALQIQFCARHSRSPLIRGLLNGRYIV